MDDALSHLTDALAGRYTIERELGAGGMATVYLARDLRHDRPVALKVLRPELAAIIGPARFLAEIRTTATLQHPHILPLYDSGEAGGAVFYVMPYVEGESLRARIGREHQLPIDDALRITLEVADALQYAHDHGVIHRDVKPENVLLQGGHALVADFGIALAVTRSGTTPRLTETGMSLGTPTYMSPEQAMGERDLTPRSDVYSLACVLYEMLAGEPPFTGPTAQAVVARVMTESPRPLAAQRHTVPPHVEAAIRKAIEKLPADRFASAAEFAHALTHPGSVRLAPAAVAPAVRLPYLRRPGRGRRAARVAGLVLVSAAAGAALWRGLGPAPRTPPHPVVRFAVELPSEARPVHATGSTIAFAPNGGRIVYVGLAPSGQRLYSRRLDDPTPSAIPGTDGGSLPFFSPDGRMLGFKRGGELFAVSIAGGPVRRIGEVGARTRGATWTPGGTIVYAADSGLMSVPATGGASRLLARPDSGEEFLWPEALPDGRTVLFTTRRGTTLRLAALLPAGTVRRLDVSGAYPRYVEPGFLVLCDSSGLVWAVPFDARRLAVTGSPVTMLTDVGAVPDGDRNLGVSLTGSFAAQSVSSAGSRIVVVDRNGAARDAGLDTGFYFAPNLAPDGRRLAVSRWTTGDRASQDVWIVDLVQRTLTRLTFDTTASRAVWTPDGRAVVYSRRVSDTVTAFAEIPADGGAPRLVATVPGVWAAAAAAPDGRSVFLHGVAGPRGHAVIARLPLAGARAPEVILAGAFDYHDPAPSPDGRWMAYVSNESGRDEVYVRALAGTGRWQISLEGGAEPQWSGTGREIYYRADDRMMAAEVRTAGGFTVEERRTLFRGDYDTDPLARGVRAYAVTPDGRTFVLLQQALGPAQDVFVTLNWFDALPERAERER